MDSSDLKAAKQKYPCPKSDDKLYKDLWFELIQEVTNRELFKNSDLRLLETLVTMYMEKTKMEEILMDEGYTYYSGEFNDVLKPRPEVSMLYKLRSEIRAYHKALGIGNRPFADAAMSSESEQDEWS
jgi:P27 family predicted phage terminase small subunit